MVSVPLLLPFLRQGTIRIRVFWMLGLIITPVILDKVSGMLNIFSKMAYVGRWVMVSRLTFGKINGLLKMGLCYTSIPLPLMLIRCVLRILLILIQANGTSLILNLFSFLIFETQSEVCLILRSGRLTVYYRYIIKMVVIRFDLATG